MNKHDELKFGDIVYVREGGRWRKMIFLDCNEQYPLPYKLASLAFTGANDWYSEITTEAEYNRLKEDK